MRLNNKGFAISAILYCILIAFLMFLLSALAMFSAGNTIMSSANDDLVNGQVLKSTLIYIQDECSFDFSKKTVVVKINSRYGTMYWPRDFGVYDSDGNLNNAIGNVASPAEYNNIKVEKISTPTDSIIITDTITGNNIEMQYADICP